MVTYSAESLKVEKERLGPIEEVALEGGSFPEVHRKLGDEVREKARDIFVRKLGGKDETGEERFPKNKEKFLEELEFVRECLLLTIQKSEDPLVSPEIRGALVEYLESLREWSNAVDLANVDHSYLEGLEKDELNVLLGLYLQNDNVGCQSGMLRCEDKSIVVWHTEEDMEGKPGERFDKLRLAKMSIAGEQEKYAFIYPDILPGAAFCFGNDFFYSVDFQHVKTASKPGLLANTATWVVFRLGGEVDPAQVFRELGPFIDGYVFNSLRIVSSEGNQKTIEAKKVEFAGDKVIEHQLGEVEGSTTFAVNVFEPGTEISEQLEVISDEGKDWYQERLNRAKRALELIPAITGREVTPQDIFRMLSFRPGGTHGEDGKAFANVDVKAHAAVRFTNLGTQILIGSGPGIKGEPAIEKDLRSKDEA